MYTWNSTCIYKILIFTRVYNPVISSQRFLHVIRNHTTVNFTQHMYTRYINEKNTKLNMKNNQLNMKNIKIKITSNSYTLIYFNGKTSPW